MSSPTQQDKAREVVVEADGGSRGNPGIAGSGTVVWSADKTAVLASLAYVVGKATNNVAEYHALKHGLDAASRLGARSVRVRMDSKLVVEQMSGRWKIKHPDMRTLAMECRAVAKTFEDVSYEWIPRKLNARADGLANDAMDACAKDATPRFLPGRGLADVASEGTQEVRSAKAGTQEAGAAVPSPRVWNGATTDPTRLLLLRHGQTQMSLDRQYSGHSDPALTQEGRRQAQCAAEHLAARGGVDAIVASPLQRCQETAAAVGAAMGLSVDTMDDLIEMDFGQWEGKTFEEVRAQDPQRHEQWLKDAQVAPPEGESLGQVYRRAKRARAAITERYGPGTVLVVSHVTPIKSILREALGAPATMLHRMHLDLASLSIAEFYSDGPTCVRLVNETSYLASRAPGGQER